MLVKTFAITFLAIMVTISVSTNQAQAQTDETLTKVEGKSILTDPVSQNILKNIEIARKQFAEYTKIQNEKNEQQRVIDDQRQQAKNSLAQELERMNKKYEEFTPRNAFTKYVSGMNSTHHAIYWDQFEYLNTKVMLAKEARDEVLQNGGSYSEAMSEYIKYAKMSKVEMINVIKNLNIKHNFADKEIQENFDANAKLPRFENDLDAPCYGCTKELSNVKVSPTEIITVEKTVEVVKKPKMTNLKDQLSSLQEQFLNSNDRKQQRTMVQEMNDIIKQIQESVNS